MSGLPALNFLAPSDGLEVRGRPLRIRVFSPADAPALSELYALSVRLLGPHRYSEQQVSAWLSLAPTPEALMARYEGERLALIADQAGTGPIAFGDVDRHGSIGYLYCHPDWARSGVVEPLYLCLEEAARSAGVRRLHVEASELAKPFFERRGFRWIERQDFDLLMVQIHNHLMEKAL